MTQPEQKIRVIPRNHPRKSASTFLSVNQRGNQRRSASTAFTQPLRAGAGFTYIELLITLTVMAVLFVPVMQLFSHSLMASSTSQDLMTATNLARWGMERIKNLNATKKQLSEIGDVMYPPADKEPLELNGMKWRIKRKIKKGSDPLEVRVHVYIVGDKDIVEENEEDVYAVITETSDEAYVEVEEDKPLMTLVTLIEDMFWEEVRPIK